ncbi:MAG TPA: hypothetical protein VI454_01565, partial [Verrucomicrobiae bacterium]
MLAGSLGIRTRDAAPTPRRLGCLRAALGLLLLLCALAARAELQFDVFLGFDGCVPESCWFPATCEVSNDGPPFNAMIEVTSGYGRSSQKILVPVELPTNTRKRISIPLFSCAGGISMWSFRLLDQRGRARAEQSNLRPRRSVAGETRLVAALVRTSAGLPVLPFVDQNRPDAQPVVARLQPEQFPDNPIVLEGLSALYLSSERAPDLKAPQVAALLAWVRGGGRLIVNVEQAADVNATPWLRDLLPCTVGGVTAIKPAGEFHEWLPNKSSTASAPAPIDSVTNAVTNIGINPKSKRRSAAANTDTTPLPLPAIVTDAQFDTAELPVTLVTPTDGEVTLSTGGLPLIVEARRQRGSVVVLAFNAEREPFLSWRHRAWFWVKLARVPEDLWTRRNWNRSYGSNLEAAFGAVLDSRQARTMPLGWLIALLTGYLLAIGPGDRWLVRRLKRPMLTWVTFPCLVAAASLLVYFIGFKLRAGETEWNELHLVDVLSRDAASAQLRGRTFGSLYSGGNRTYRFHADAAGAFSTFRGELLGGGVSALAAGEGRVLRQGNHFTADIPVPVWTSQLFVNDWVRTTPTPVGLRVRTIQGGHEVEIDNRLGRALTNVTAAINGFAYSLGDVPAKQKKTFTTAGGGT